MLGSLALSKTAQEAVPGAPILPGMPQMGLLQRLMQAGTQEMRTGQYPSFQAPGPSPQQTAGFVTANQGLLEGLQSALGPLGATAGMLGMPWIQRFANKIGLDMTKPYQYGYGGDPKAFAEQQAVSGVLMQHQLLGAGETGAKVIDQLSGFAKKNFGDAASGFTGWLQSLSPNTLGMFIQQFVFAFPQLQSIMSRLDPAFVSDFSPVVKATYQETGGEFDPEVFKENYQEFQNAYNSGMFGDIPAQVALHSLGFTKDQLGPRAPMSSVVNNAVAADAFLRKGLAPSFGEAMTLVDAINPGGEAAFNPYSAVAYADYLDDLAKKGGVDRRMLQQAGRYAKENNVSVGAAMNAVVMAGRARARMGGTEGARYGDLAAQAITQAGDSTNMRLLAAAYEGDKKARAYIDRAFASGDTDALNKISRRLRNNPRALARSRFADGQAFVSRMAVTNPHMLESFVQGEVRRAAGENKQLQQLLANKDELARRLKKRDFSGLSDETVEALSKGGGRLGAVALTIGETPKSDFRPPPKIPFDPDVTRLGLPYPEYTPPTKPTVEAE